ncbi:Vacuolar Ca(2+)/H(+) exchanger [Saitozyma sp. JCM 24511]|nr:Vacuolar Ca(2+)/H(+) exchanger [Saitozyma sp. JCM 24511]
MVEHSLSIAEDPEPDIDPDIRGRSINHNHNHNQQQQHQAQPAQLLPPQLPPLAGADGTSGEGTTVDFASISPDTAPSHKTIDEQDVVDAGVQDIGERHEHADRADLDWEKGTVGEDEPHRSPQHHMTLAPVPTSSQLGSIEERAGTAVHPPDQESDADADEADDTPVQPSWGTSIKNTIKHVPILCAVPVILPVAWALHFSHQSPVAVFITCLVAIVPLAGGLGFATEELALRVGEAWGGLLNASFGNAVELLIAILALVKGEIDIVQASMVGSILGNILLVLGMSYFAGGLRFHEQMYAIPGAQMQISLLSITVMAIALPAAYHYAYPSTQELVSATRAGSAPEGVELQNLLKMSRGLSFILLAVYAAFLCFQLYTHAYLFRIPRERQTHPLPGPTPSHERVFPIPDWVGSLADSSSTSSSASTSQGGHGHGGHRRNPFRRMRRWSVRSRDDEQRQQELQQQRRNESQEQIQSQLHTQTQRQRQGKQRDIERDGSGGLPVPMTGGKAITGATGATGARLTSANLRVNTQAQAKQYRTDPVVQRVLSSDDTDAGAEDDGHAPRHPQPLISWWFAIGLLTAMTALAGVTAEFLVDSIDGLVATGNVSREFVGLILFPVIGNSVEHVTAVTVSVKDKLNLSMSIAVGSSIQVSLCILPVLVLIGWAIGQPMTLFFDVFETIALVISVLLVNFAISDGRTNYLEGFVMMMAFLSIALVCWFYDPASAV